MCYVLQSNLLRFIHVLNVNASVAIVPSVPRENMKQAMCHSYCNCFKNTLYESELEEKPPCLLPPFNLDQTCTHFLSSEDKLDKRFLCLPKLLLGRRFGLEESGQIVLTQRLLIGWGGRLVLPEGDATVPVFSSPHPTGLTKPRTNSVSFVYWLTEIEMMSSATDHSTISVQGGVVRLPLYAYHLVPSGMSL